MTVTLITGTSTGIGQTTALHLARQGHHVFASMRNPATGSTELRDAARQEGLKLEIIQLDVNEAESSTQAVQEVLERAGQLDVLINNAGIGGHGPVEEMSEARLREVFETNFFGAMRLIRLVLPTMRQSRKGAIVNVTSVAGRLASGGGSAYSASKFALEAASESLAQEVRGFNIRVLIIEPGFIKTPIFAKGKSELDVNSPYHPLNLRRRRRYTSLIAQASPPALVAETIHSALEAEQPKLRYLVGEDAKRMVAARQAMTDEAWVDFEQEMSLDDYAERYFQYFGLKI